ncbi:glycosyltransferase family 2 protein [Nocardioides sp.]|uniref:glycosyltransferase family 2 protein n=1 Tax=Nocardioides sp. TaxID=35761 RepID=UPI002606A35F|nr:glycosyltransferase family 2 protein [Nocardioides sp.]
MNPASTPTVVVAVLTYQRPDTLGHALASLRRQLTQVPGARLVVIDNDVEPSAAPIVAPITAADPRVRYVHQPEPGIAAARNSALEAAAGADLLVFIDDDEQPSQRWLAQLVSAWGTHHQPAAVVGPVVSIFEGDPDPWITAGGFFRRLRHTTGDEVSTAATNNLLLDLCEVRRLGLRFDEAFGLTGGSDTVFTRQLSGAGGRIVWCDEAVVFDMVPADRATRGWVRARASRLGNSDLRAQVHLARPGLPRLTTRVRGTLRGGVRLLGGGARMLYGRLLGSLHDEARGTRTALRGAGMVRGSWGSVVAEYSR